MPLVTCGFCKDKHSVAGVKACAAKHYAPKVVAPAIVPAGRYALDVDGVTKFYVVDKPESGAWKGKTFLSVLASDDKHPVKFAAKDKVLAAIAVDVKGAMISYGLLVGKCGRCGRTLTDAESRAAGIGPVCAGKEF